MAPDGRAGADEHAQYVAGGPGETTSESEYSNWQLRPDLKEKVSLLDVFIRALLSL